MLPTLRYVNLNTMDSLVELKRGMREYGVTDIAITGGMAMQLWEINLPVIDDVDVIIFNEISLEKIKNGLAKNKYGMSDYSKEVAFSVKMAQEPMGEEFYARTNGILFHLLAPGAVNIYEKGCEFEYRGEVVYVRWLPALLSDLEKKLERLNKTEPGTPKQQKEIEFEREKTLRRIGMIKDKIENEKNK